MRNLQIRKEGAREPAPGINVDKPGRPANKPGRPYRWALNARWLYVWVALALTLFLPAGDVHAQSPGATPATTQATISRLEASLKSVAAENRRLAERVRQLEQRSARAQTVAAPAFPRQTPGTRPSGAESFSVINNSAPATQSSYGSFAPPQAGLNSTGDQFRVTYDNGFAILPKNPDDTPFSLKVNGQDEFRYTGFSRGAAFWTDSAGNQNPISNSSNLQIPRGRLIFSGRVLLPNLTYLLNIDYNTVTSNPIGFRAYELSYRFSRAIALSVGQSKVPGSREWLESAFAPLEGPDRTMATTFFRPSLSQGIWLTGEPLDRLYYQAMMSNGFNTLNLTPTQFTHHLCWSGSVWWEPWGSFGRGYADWEAHETPVVRVGSSYTFALGQGSQSASDAVENSSIRLSDGTLITQPGAFAPGVTLQSYDISLAAIDLAFKYRGWSLSTEWYAQELSSLKGNGPLPIRSTQAYGGFVQGGYFIIPQRVELYSRASFVTGHYGSGSETAGGLNWFPLPGRSNLRFTFDTAWLDRSPADQNRTGFVAGQTGVLIRTQITAVY
ncbi:MAG TPA: hypothetical protein VHI52_21325 [Verrucomicrobiae bacterium]|nr:hypothetical protein [Verrucomicrobiae bacterium]HWB08284.1 hypothetical protein [Pirellulales bacterium]